eukprot:scaffold27823_cov129-Isochrysis_galbana.AAC.4
MAVMRSTVARSAPTAGWVPPRSSASTARSRPWWDAWAPAWKTEASAARSNWRAASSDAMASSMASASRHTLHPQVRRMVLRAADSRTRIDEKAHATSEDGAIPAPRMSMCPRTASVDGCRPLAICTHRHASRRPRWSAGLVALAPFRSRPSAAPVSSP